MNTILIPVIIDQDNNEIIKNITISGQLIFKFVESADKILNSMNII
jgi:hypothetical protein